MQTAGATGMVCTQHPLAVDAALEMLDAGGSSVDAAVAAAAVLTVVDPASTGLGGDLFALHWAPGADAPVALSSSGPAPAGLTVDDLRSAGFSRMPTIGPWSISVPGAPAGWRSLLERYGRLDVAEVLRSAVQHAREGFEVTPVVAAEWAEEVEKLRHDATAAQMFLFDGRSPRAGERFANPDLARTLERFIDGADEPFYRGDVAEAMAAAVQALGGPLQAADLAAWNGPLWVDPLTTSYRGLDLFELPPPVQTIVVLEALRIYEVLRDDDPAVQDHYAIEAIKLAYEDANRYVADPAFCELPADELLADAHIAAQRERIAPTSALVGDVGPRSDTVYVAVADDDGGACSLIQSIYHGFGSGVAVPGTGIVLHNRASGFVLDDTHPNRPEPGKRPLHTIMPAMIGNNGTFAGCLGVVGGYMQPQGQLQVLRNVLDRGMQPQEAVDAPRFRVYGGRQVALDEGYDPAVAEGLRRRGHEVTAMPPFEGGGAQLILRDDNGYRGGSDRRKDGHAAGR